MPKCLFRYVVAVIFVVIMGFSYGYLKAFLPIKNPNENINPNHIEKNTSIMQETKLNPRAKFIYHTYYLGCGDELIEEKYFGDKYTDCTKDELAQFESDWEIVSFTPNEVKLRREVNGICNNHFYIGVQDGYVSFFQGIPGVQSILIEQTDIIVDILREDDRSILEKGLVVSDKDEFLKIREGLTN